MSFRVKTGHKTGEAAFSNRFAKNVDRLPSRLRGLALMFLLIGLAPLTAYAACTSPAGVAGEMGYNLTGSGDFEYCNGTSWVSMETGDMGSGGSGPCANWLQLNNNTIGSLGPVIKSPEGAIQDDQFGATVAISSSASIAVIGMPGCKCSLKGQNDNEGVAYIFNTMTGSLVATLSNPDPEANDYFGSAVATDGTTVVVGAWNDNLNYGEVYIFDTSGTLLRTIPTPNSSATYFGYSVAVDGNNTVVSAHGYSNSAGVAYVYDTTTGNLVTTLSNPAPASGDSFGRSVAISGTTAVVGAPYDMPGGTTTGAAYVFDTSTGNLAATLNNPDPSNSYFGNSVAISGTTAVIGAPNKYRYGIQNTGEAYIFDTTDGSLVATLENPSHGYNAFFGTSVAISGSTVLVGADWGYGINGTYIFDSTTGSHIGTINNPYPDDDYTDFGANVAIDGTAVIVAAAAAHVDGVLDAGRAYIYELETGDGLQATLRNPSFATGSLGTSVDVHGDIAVAGAPYQNNDGLTNTGFAYTYNVQTGAPLATLDFSPTNTLAYFGRSVAIWDNYAIVGAPNDSTTLYHAGAVHIFNATTGALISAIDNPQPSNSDSQDDDFGRSVAIWNTYAIIGDPNDDPGTLSNAGSAYIYDRDTGNLLSTLTDPSPAAGEQFGKAVAIYETTVLVGSGNDVHIFDATTGNFVSTLSDPNGTGNGFGGLWSTGGGIAVHGNLAIIGAALADPGGVNNAGEAYVFDVTDGSLVATLSNPTPTAGDSFGGNVDIVGGIAMVGFWYNTSDPSVGEAYIFDATNGNLLATVTDPNPAINDDFGYDVALTDSLALVGAGGDKGPTGTDYGAAYVYDLTATPNVQTLVDPNKAYGAVFGRDMGFAANTAVVGGVNKAYLYNTTDSSLIATLTSPSAAATSSFGSVVATDGTLAVVGDTNDDPGGVVDTGAAYLFDASTGNYLRELRRNNWGSLNKFPSSLAISGNRAVGGDDNRSVSGFSGAGRAFIFNTDTGSTVAHIQNPSPEAYDNFGSSVAIDGSTVLIGADGDKPGGIGSGSVYVYTSDGTFVRTLDNPDPDANDTFGRSVAISGTTALVSVGQENGILTAYVFDTTTGNLLQTLKDPDPTTGGNFGASVAIDGNYAIIGVRYNIPQRGVPYVGAAYIFDITTGIFLRGIYSPRPTDGALFGETVAIDGTTAVVTAENTDQNLGAVYVYCIDDGSGGGTTACSTAGEMQYDGASHVITWCDGTSLKAAGTAGSGGAGCSTPASSEGAMLYNTGVSKMQFCDGASWVDIP